LFKIRNSLSRARYFSLKSEQDAHTPDFENHFNITLVSMPTSSKISLSPRLLY